MNMPFDITQLSKPYLSDVIVLAAGQRQTKSVGDSDYFGIISIDGGDFVNVSFDRSSSTRPWYTSTGHKFDTVFSSVEFDNTQGSTGLVVTYVCAKGLFNDNRFTFTGTINVQDVSPQFETDIYTNSNPGVYTIQPLAQLVGKKRFRIIPAITNLYPTFYANAVSNLGRVPVPAEGLEFDSISAFSLFVPPPQILGGLDGKVFVTSEWS